MINEKELPWCISVAVLMDSCTVMRGSKNGFETNLRESVCTSSNSYWRWFISLHSQYLSKIYKELENETPWWNQNMFRNSLKCTEKEETYKSQKRKKRENFEEHAVKQKQTHLYFSIYFSALQVMRYKNLSTGRACSLQNP